MIKLLKKLLIISFLFISINMPASDYTYGIKIGGTYSTASLQHGEEGGEYVFTDNNYYWGTFFSFYGYRNLYKEIDLQFEANYNQRGVTYEYEGYHDNHMIYVTIPSLELVSLLKFNKSNFTLYFGLFSSLSFYDKKETNYSSSPSTHGEEFTLDYGFILGFEFKYKKYLVDFRYNQGFNDFVSYNGSNGGHTYYYFSQQFVLSFGYEF